MLYNHVHHHVLDLTCVMGAMGMESLADVRGECCSIIGECPLLSAVASDLLVNELR